MTYKVARFSLPFLITVFLTTVAFAGQDDDKNNKKKPKNSDVDNIGTRDINKGNILPLMSLEKEIALGQQLAAQVERQVKLLNDPAVNEYVNRVEQNIVRNSDAKVPFTIRIIESDEINAFALPGGFLFVNTGLILAADQEAEMAGVLAHETAHVAARHGAKTAAKETAVNVASIPLIFLGGVAGMGARQAAGLAIPIGFLKFTRGQEAEADYLGAQYMYKAGYDPSAMLSFFEKLQAKEKAKPGTMSSLFTDHPPTEARIAAIKQEIETILPNREQYVVSTSEFDAMKARLMSLESGHFTENEKKPTVKRRSPTGRPPDSDPETASSRKAPIPEDAGDQTTPDDRPTLKRKISHATTSSLRPAGIEPIANPRCEI
jgi:predicted Zn-dependent protease